MKALAKLLICYLLLTMLVQFAMTQLAASTELLIFTSSLLMILLGYLFGYVTLPPFFTRKQGKSRETISFQTGLVATLLVIATSQLSGALVELLHLPNLLEDKFDALVMSGLGIATILFVGPLGEEIIFRRGVMGELLKSGKSGRYAIIVSALIFALIHFNPAQSCSALLVGLILGWYYYRTGSIQLCTIAHIVNNGIALLSLLYPNLLAGIPSYLPIGVSLLIIPFALEYLYLRLPRFTHEP